MKGGSAAFEGQTSGAMAGIPVPQVRVDAPRRRSLDVECPNYSPVHGYGYSPVSRVRRAARRDGPRLVFFSDPPDDPRRACAFDLSNSDGAVTDNRAAGSLVAARTRAKTRERAPPDPRTFPRSRRAAASLGRVASGARRGRAVRRESRYET